MSPAPPRLIPLGPRRDDPDMTSAHGPDKTLLADVALLNVLFDDR